MANDDIQLETPQPRAGTLPELGRWNARFLADTRAAVSRLSEWLQDVDRKIKKVEESTAETETTTSPSDGTSHDNLTDVESDDHHERFTGSEAQAAVAPALRDIKAYNWMFI